MTFVRILAGASLAVGLASVSAAAAHAGTNLVTNGDFSAGDAGFTSDYTEVFAADGQHAAYPPKVFAVTTNPNNVHNLWVSFGDHTAPADPSGPANMLVVNGAADESGLTASVWAESGIAVSPNTNYAFSLWLASSYPLSPAQVELKVNGGAVGSAFADTTAGNWTQVTGAWNSGASTTANLSFVDLNTAYSGNDFVVDDINFAAAVPEPATWAMMLAGFGGLGAAMRSRRGRVAATV